MRTVIVEDVNRFEIKAHVLGIALNEMYGSSPHPMENIETLI